MSWKDKRVVNFITTLPVIYISVQRRVKSGTRGVERLYRFVTYDEPTTRSVYNKKMGGVDTAGFYANVL